MCLSVIDTGSKKKGVADLALRLFDCRQRLHGGQVFHSQLGIRGFEGENFCDNLEFLRWLILIGQVTGDSEVFLVPPRLCIDHELSSNEAREFYAIDLARLTSEFPRLQLNPYAPFQDNPVIASQGYNRLGDLRYNSLGSQLILFGDSGRWGCWIEDEIDLMAVATDTEDLFRVSGGDKVFITDVDQAIEEIVSGEFPNYRKLKDPPIEKIERIEKMFEEVSENLRKHYSLE